MSNDNEPMAKGLGGTITGGSDDHVKRKAEPIDVDAAKQQDAANQPILNPMFAVTEPDGTQRQIRVAVCIPSFDTWKADTGMALIGMGTYTMTQGIAMAFVNEKSSMVSKARNSLSEKSMQFGADYILFVDSDLVFPADALCRLLAAGKDIIGATYNKRVPPYETLGHFIGAPRDLSAGGIVEADYMPGGFLLIKTSVLKALPQPWFFETYYRTPENALESFLGIADDQYSEPAPAGLREAVGAVPGLKDWLQTQRDGKVEFDARYMSEDYNFCRKARKAGFQLWCDLSLTFQMAHIGEQHVTCAAPKGLADAMANLGAGNVGTPGAIPGTTNIDLSAA